MTLVTGLSPPHVRPALMSTALPTEGASASLQVPVPDKTRATRDPIQAITIGSGYTRPRTPPHLSVHRSFATYALQELRLPSRGSRVVGEEKHRLAWYSEMYERCTLTCITDKVALLSLAKMWCCGTE